ncbi:aminotransferase class III-fold pyridoxal phosphate-dependent enzyme [Mycoplasma sp. P36-A1]|uniref:aminotransferase class III-fold pyridoxal phosphate-dependent enzyme n=1 Tax=Mycoplasma sp. P36-A1 TaxID=3252900 RepID=UPI003C2AB1CE
MDSSMKNEYNKYLLPIINSDDYIIKSGKGLYLIDEYGNELLDCNGGQFCTIFGHSNEYFKEILEKVNNTLVHTNVYSYSLSVLKASKQLDSIMLGFNPRSIFLSTGSEAINFSIKYARHYTKKKMVITNDHSFLAISNNFEKNLFSTITTPLNSSDVAASLQEFELLASSNQVACFTIEPIISMGGMLFLPQEFFVGLREICNKYHILLIFDESQCGFARTGKWYYYQQINVVPDIIISAKGVGNGYPVSVVSVNANFVNEQDPIATASTHQNAPYAASIVSAGIDYIEKNNLLNNNLDNGNYFLQKLKELCYHKKLFNNPRGLGLMCAIDINNTNYQVIFNDLKNYCLRNNLIINGTSKGKTIRFIPPYTISTKEIDYIISVLNDYNEMELAHE